MSRKLGPNGLGYKYSKCVGAYEFLYVLVQTSDCGLRLASWVHQISVRRTQKLWSGLMPILFQFRNFQSFCLDGSWKRREDHLFQKQLVYRLRAKVIHIDAPLFYIQIVFLLSSWLCQIRQSYYILDLYLTLNSITFDILQSCFRFLLLGNLSTLGGQIHSPWS